MPISQQEIEFSDLLTRYYPLINSLCFRCCWGDAYYFDELRQECIIEIWTEFTKYGLARFNGDSTESTWIFKISCHAVIHYFRNSKHTAIQSISDTYSTELLAYDEGTNDWGLIDDLKEHLDKQECNLLEHYLNDNSYSTIARIEGITESNARKRMSRLLNKLRILIHK